MPRVARRLLFAAALLPFAQPVRADTGRASWMAESLRGRRTASGAPYDPRAMTAAHRTLPLGSRTRVTCLSTGRSVVVTINDRGPWSEARMIDVSAAAAEQLGFRSRGLTTVRLSAP